MTMYFPGHKPSNNIDEDLIEKKLFCIPITILKYEKLKVRPFPFLLTELSSQFNNNPSGPYGNPRQVLRLRSFVFRRRFRFLLTKTSRPSYIPIPLNLRVATLSLPDNFIIGLVDEHGIFRGLYNQDRSRVKIHFTNFHIVEMSNAEDEQFPSGRPFASILPDIIVLRGERPPPHP